MMKRSLIVFLVLLSGCGATAQEPAPEPVTRSARLVFIGDVMSHAPQVTAARADARETCAMADSAGSTAGYDYTEIFRLFRPVFSDADVVIANLETTLRTTPPYTGYPSFAAPAELAFAMREAGIDIATTANNHICDKGATGIRSTLALLDSAGLKHTGAFTDSADRLARNPLRFEAGGLRFALLNYTYGTNGIPVPKGLMVNPIDTTVIASDLSRIGRDSTDCVIVSYHWGDEYRRQPNNAQKELAAWTRARGADIIIGGHPHVVEPMEVYYNADSTAVTGATYYSLGNFVSNQRRRYTDGGMTAEITVTRTAGRREVLSLKNGVRGEYHAGEGGMERERSSSAIHLVQPTLNYDFGYRLFWVYTPVQEGIMRYRVLPAAVADTMLSAPGHETARAQYDLFMRDTRKLLNNK